MQQSSASVGNIGNNIPDVMAAAQQLSYGDAKDVLQLKSDVPIPKEVKELQVLIRNHAVSINAINWKLLNGNMSIIETYAFSHIPDNKK
ncbi:unnamed protein product [Rotaria sp. Silwood1]|nr:unnamed protein product [Rotaria sp. Silwood1]CAF1278480.1 unnamed protein product [Rotaria sp. Silwood1]CAF3477038.1 unnamed protein product [Rotaria sp. Silwood1]CAF3558506.1 unnamed protein product [Rotaria sp. Silwood1]CAF4967361.1 unnamed protein product [Rotaria sp. Silwood1]